MANTTSFAGILRPASGSNLLDRAASSSSQLSESQNFVDQMVSSSMDEATKGSTLLAMFGAGAVSRLTRAGVMSMALGERAVLPMMARGGSYAIALANESATFAGIERGFHSSQTSFEKDWARAFINLGSLKLLGTAAEGQNLLLQHLLTDLGMVGGQQMGAKFGLVEKPQGSFAQQMIQAEGMNWGMKGSLALLHGFSPGLSAMERSVDLALKSQETNLFPSNRWNPFLQLAPEGVGILSTDAMRSEPPKGPDRFAMSAQTGGEGGGSGKGSSSTRSFERAQYEWVDAATFELAERDPSNERVISAVKDLVAKNMEVGFGPKAAEGLAEFARVGVKSLEMSKALHFWAVGMRAEGNVLQQPEKRQLVIELEWAAALATPQGNEYLRGDFYVNATWFALEAGRPNDARKIIFEALRDDFGAVAENKLRAYAKNFMPWNKDRRFIMSALKEAKAHLK